MAYYGQIPSAIPDKDTVEQDFWASYKIPADFDSFFEPFGPEFTSWCESTRCWGEEKGHQISVLYEGDRVEWITSKVDARIPCTVFLHQLVEVAIRLDGLLLIGKNEDEAHTLEPDFATLSEHFRTSVASRFLLDPVGTLKSLPKSRFLK